MNKITSEMAKRLIASTQGSIFSVLFVKKDGTPRKMNCRLGVKKGVKGVGMAYNPADYDLIPVFDMQKGDFRMVNIETLREITVDNETFSVIE